MDLRHEMARISVSSCRITGLYGDWARLHGTTYNALMLLYALHQSPGCTQKEITREWLIPKQTVHTIVKDLERRGYVDIRPGRDQKEKALCFTEEGRLYAREILEPLLELEERVLRRMGAESVEAMARTEEAFAAALSEEVAHG